METFYTSTNTLRLNFISLSAIPYYFLKLILILKEGPYINFLHGSNFLSSLFATTNK